MNKNDLLFYNIYEEFYIMAENSEAFRTFCKEAFGEDFSQDGFSDVNQINMIVENIPAGEDIHILDIGCGNGKMLGYLQQKTGAYIHGFDYSENAIATARALFTAKAEFREGIIGEIDYPTEAFDAITSMDTMYFAKNMTEFVSQIKKWLKQDGVFVVGYQEGDVIPKTENVYTTLLVQALDANDMHYQWTDITRQTYELLQKKRNAAINHRMEFEAEGHQNWYELLVAQTDYASCTYEEFQNKMARYIFVVRK